jgi:hypothetical protein
MPRVNHVKRARKDQGSCGKCGDKLPAGSGYRWIKFRYGGKRQRCLKGGCAFLNAIETTSESFTPEDVRSVLETAAEQIKEVAEEYRESAENIRENFSESPTADECEEKADELESWADDLESWDSGEPDEFEYDGDAFNADDVERDDGATDEEHEAAIEQAKEDHAEKVRDARGAWAETIIEEAHSALSECPL